MDGMQSLYSQDPFADILEEYIDEVSGLWQRRHSAVKHSSHSLQTINKLDARIEKHLAGLRLECDTAWVLSREALVRFGDGGETFVAAILAIESNESYKIDYVLKHVFEGDSETAFHGLVSAFAWLPLSTVHPWLKQSLRSDQAEVKHLAMAVCRLRQDNPGHHLKEVLSDDNYLNNTALKVCALRVAGEMRRHELGDLINNISQKYHNASLENTELSDCDGIHHSCAFWSHWSACLLGHKEAHDRLKSYAIISNPYQEQAIELVFSHLPYSSARLWIAELIKSKDQTRQVLNACRVLGDPESVPMIIQYMADPIHARYAGDVFSMIIGVDLEASGLNQDQPPQQWPSIMHALEGDELHDAVTVDVALAQVYVEQDTGLPWPDVKKIHAYWNAQESSWALGCRVFMGQEHDSEKLQQVLVSGNQRQRRAAALELARLHPNRPLINIAARGGS